MKWLYCLFFIICGVSAQAVDKVEPSPVQQFLEGRCFKIAKQGDTYDQLVGLSHDFYKYAEYTATFLPLHNEHFCKNEKPILTLKLKDVTDQLSKCLPPEEKFLPDFVQKVFVDFMQFLCERESANVKTFFSSHGKQCQAALSQNNASQEAGTCFSRHFTSVGDQGYVTKDMMCRDIGLVKGCFSGVLQRYCPGFEAFKDLNEQFFRHINKPCSACILGISNTVTYLCVVAALLFRKFI